MFESFYSKYWSQDIILLFVLVDLIGSITLFVSLTQRLQETYRKKTAAKACVVAAAILSLFAFFGNQMGMPILAGRGAITTVMVLVTGDGLERGLQVLFSSVLVCLVSFLILSYAIHISKLLGCIGANLFGRLMGLIRAVISVEYMANGLAELFPGWVQP